MDLKAIGKRIKSARESRGMTQEQLAEKVNISASHMSVIERGIKPPKLETFVEIANALEVDANSLLADVLAVSNEIVSSQLSNKLTGLTQSAEYILDLGKNDSIMEISWRTNLLKLTTMHLTRNGLHTFL